MRCLDSRIASSGSMFTGPGNVKGLPEHSSSSLRQHFHGLTHRKHAAGASSFRGPRKQIEPTLLHVDPDTRFSPAPSFTATAARPLSANAAD